MAVSQQEPLSRLGFGLMRLPRHGVKIDVKQTCEMVDMFLDAGFTYFDTAYIYPGSEKATKKALVKRHPRDSYLLATKLNTMVAPTTSLAKRQFEASLKHLGTDYVDYYLLHNLMGPTYKSYEALKLWDYVAELKEQGRVRHYGFSFHGGPQLLERLLTEHPDAEFVQLQLNYADWESPSITARANYEVARAHDLPIIVMEPVKGGHLANPSAQVRALMDEVVPGRSYASWALRFAAGLEGVLSVLSGMSNIEQMQDNLSFMRDFQPLDEREMEVIRQAQEIMGRSPAIPCTSCGYCVKQCPQEIPIPQVFSAMNKQLMQGQASEARADYASATAGGASAADCIACGACERACPQHIDIIERLKLCASELG